MEQREFELRYGHVARSDNKEAAGKGPKSKLALLKNAAVPRGGDCCNAESLRRGVFWAMPILGWLSKYDLRKNLHCDFVTGLTVGIMVVPQGMAYATLAKVPPVYGLYSCFFPTFFYMLFGSSPHISMGTFAVASMMVGNLRSKLMPEMPTPGANHSNASLSGVSLDIGGDPLVLTSALTFGAGILQLLMALFRLSFLTNYISDTLVSGFTTGAAVHVLTSQISKLFGIRVASYGGPGLVLFTWRDLILSIAKLNIFTLSISVFGLTFLAIGRDWVNPWFRKRFRVPFPLELFLVIAAIIFSTLIGLKQNYDVRIVDIVPQGMPSPKVPRIALLPHIWDNCLSIAVICYAFVFSLGKMFAKKHKYKLDPNQELYALGTCTVLASLFPVFPFGASLSRSSLCEMTGAKTQLHALFSSILLLVVILWIGPLLEPLPIAILACIVVISLKPLFLQFRELPRLWRISFFDFAIWLVAFTTTAFIDITYGLGISMLFSILTVVLKEQWPNFNRLGTDKQATSSVFRPLNLYTALVEPASQMNVQIWRFESPLHFGNAAKFVESVAEVCQQISSAGCSSNSSLSDDSLEIKISDGKIDSADSPLEEKGQEPKKCFTSNSNSSTEPLQLDSEKKRRRRGEAVEEEEKGGGGGMLILDCSAVSHIDATGLDALVELYSGARRLNVALKFAAFSDALLATFHRCDLFGKIPERCFFPSIQDCLLSTAVSSSPLSPFST